MILSRKRQAGKWLLEFLFVLVALVYIVPIWMVLTNSFKPGLEANELRLSIPNRFEFENYAIVFKEAQIVKGLLNGIILGGAVVVASVFLASMASFYLARTQGKRTRLFYNFFVSGLIIPVAIIPTYFILSSLNLTNTYLGLILIFTTYAIPFSIFMYTGFIKTISRELDEAGIMEGCNPYQLFFRVIFPLLAPVSITIVVFNFLFVWNEVGVYLYFANGEKWPITMSIYSFFGKYTRDWNLVFPDIMIGIIPCLLIVWAGQRYIISGLTAGAVKG